MAYKVVQQKEPKKDTLGIESAYRIPALSAAKTGAAIPGFAGDTLRFINDLIAAPAAKALGYEPVPYEQTYLGKAIPTTEQHIRNIEENIPFFKPKNKLEESTSNIAKDAASLFLSGQAFRMGRYALTPMRSLGISTASNLAGEGVEAWTGDKSKGDMVKAGTMLVFSLFNPTTARNISSNLYSQANQLLPQTATTNASNLLNRLTNLENRILQGRPRGNLAPSEEFVLNQSDRFRNLIQNGEVNMRSLAAQKRSLNEDLQRQLFDLPDRASRARARELTQEIGHAARDTMRQYGQQNPRWWDLQSSADIAHGSIQQSNYISRFLERFMRGRPEGLAHVFGIGAPALAGKLVGASLPGASAAVYMGTKIGHRILQSPALRRHYAKVVGAAAASNSKSVNRELDSMEKELEKEEKSKKGKFKIVNQNKGSSSPLNE